jgi:hypothetical protein
MEIFRLAPRCSSADIRRIAAESAGDYTLLYTGPTELKWVHWGCERMVQIADETRAAMVYSDRFFEGTPAPVIDCQSGGVLRDDFDFGGLQLYRTDLLRQVVAQMDADYAYAGLYDLRLRLSRLGAFVHIPEFLYYEQETDKRASGEKQFDYVDPRNRKVQIEMEQACTAHLKATGAYLEPKFTEPALWEGDFPVEASVVIPCKNRVRTIADAVESALAQKTDFPYNVIVVDDNSTDGTREVLERYKDNPAFLLIEQDPSWHAIGGNWNAAIHHPQCGRFALQLDSDDLYSGPDTVQKFVDCFRREHCAMVVGTYRITDFQLNELPPGIIDHREWTEENGRNNALRINGLGAPRGFWTPLLRSLNFPTVKYGEDYAVALRISREYRIGRIWDVLYNCRRWDDNSDAALDIDKVNINNTYKDRIRSWELAARIRFNADKNQ